MEQAQRARPLSWWLKLKVEQGGALHWRSIQDYHLGGPVCVVNQDAAAAREGGSGSLLRASLTTRRLLFVSSSGVNPARGCRAADSQPLRASLESPPPGL